MELSCRLRHRSSTGKIVGVSLRLSPMIYSVSGMLTISENQVPRGCEVRSAGARHGLPRLEAGMTGEVLACRLATNQSAVARSERDRHRTSLDSIGRVAVPAGSDTANVIEQKRPV